MFCFRLLNTIFKHRQRCRSTRYDFLVFKITGVTNHHIVDRSRCTLEPILAHEERIVRILDPHCNKNDEFEGYTALRLYVVRNNEVVGVVDSDEDGLSLSFWFLRRTTCVGNCPPKLINLFLRPCEVVPVDIIEGPEADQVDTKRLHPV